MAQMTNGYKYYIKNNICFLEINRTEGIYTESVVKAQNEICLNDNLRYFNEIRILKVGALPKELINN
jgi:hypothetical protein